MNRLRIAVNTRPRKLKGAIGLGSGPEGRIEKIRNVLTHLVRHERIEGSYRYLDETQGYAELLIQQAILNGPEDKETQEKAHFWLREERDLVEKLFDELVPRYKDSVQSYTNQHQLPNRYPENHQRCVLELRGNPYPAIGAPQDSSRWITNVLLEAAQKKYGTQSVQRALLQDRETENYSKQTPTSDQTPKPQTPTSDPTPKPQTPTSDQTPKPVKNETPV